MRRPVLALAAILMTLASPAFAQVGTPGNGPLTPGGPRSGLGPPSLSDSVPDLRLHSDAGGIPGAGPPIDRGSARAPGETVFRSDRGGRERYGRRCETPVTVCTLARPAPIGSACGCRLRGGRRLGGSVTP